MNALPLLALVATLALAGCERERRPFTTPAQNTTAAASQPRQSANQPAAPLAGGTQAVAADTGPYDENAYAVAQGKRLFRWYNCNGCHANGGGGIGPPLMDEPWRYGSNPASVFASIMQGRPNGMPSFGGHIPEDQAWQLVAYVRSTAGLLRKDVTPSRADTLSAGPPENSRTPQDARPEQVPPQVPTGGPQR